MNLSAEQIMQRAKSGLETLPPKWKKFFSHHKYLSAALICYLVVMLLSQLYSPWSTGVNAVDDAVSLFGNTRTQAVVLKILLFGVYDIFELSGFTDSSSYSAGDGGLYFLCVACIAFFLQKIIIDKFLNITFYGGFFEKSVISFFADNIMTYFSSLLSFWISPGIIDSMSSSSGGFFGSLIVIILTIGLIILALPYFFYLLGYLYCFNIALNIITLIDESLHWYAVFKSPIIVLVSVVLAIMIDVIVSGVINLIIKIILKLLSARFPALSFLQSSDSE